MAFSGSAEWVFTGGIDHEIRAWDLRGASKEPAFSLVGHTGAPRAGASRRRRPPDAPSVVSRLARARANLIGLRFSHDGRRILSNGMDGVVRMWDARPFCPAPTRLEGEFTGTADAARGSTVVRDANGVTMPRKGRTMGSSRSSFDARGPPTASAWPPAAPIAACTCGGRRRARWSTGCQACMRAWGASRPSPLVVADLIAHTHAGHVARSWTSTQPSPSCQRERRQAHLSRQLNVV